MTTKRSNPKGIQKLLTLCSALVLVLAMSVTLAACGSKTFTVKFDANTNATVTGMPSAITDVKKDATITEPTAPTRDDYYLVGWYKEADGTTAWNFESDKVKKDITLYAKWAEITVPGKVATFTATPSFYSVTLAWTAGAENGSAITKYQVQIDNEGWVDVASGLTYTFTDLDDHTKYDFKVLAVNGKGAGEETILEEVTTLTDIAPDAVTELTATEIGSNNVLLEWNAPANNGGSVVTGYEVRHRIAAGSWSAWTDEIAPEYNFTGLDTGIRYEFQVRAVNAKGAGVEESIVVVPFRVELDGTQVAWTDAEMPTGFNGYVLEFTFVDAGEVFYHSIIGTTNDLELAGFDWSAIGVNFGEDGYEGGVEIRVALRPTGKLPLSHTLRYSTNFVTAEVIIEPIYPELIAPMIAWDATDNELIVWNVVDANADGIRVHVRVRVPFGKGWLWISLASGELDLSEVSLGLGAIPEILGIEEFDLGEHSIRLEVYSNNLEVASAFSNMLNFTVS